MKKLLTRAALGLGTLGVIVGGAAAFSAFEAHIINVTARIENATGVNVTKIGFGTVFPQEYLVQQAEISLSQSFKDQSRVRTVNYVLKQKPKVKLPCVSTNGVVCDPNADPQPGDPYAVITVGSFTGPAWQYCENNLPVNSPYTFDPTDVYWQHCYIPLANYLSKHSEVTTNGGFEDGSVYAFHPAYQWSNNGVSSLNPNYVTSGTLTNNSDLSDTWTIDLAVPCFLNQCDQGWATWFDSHNGNNPGNANDYVLPTNSEHKVFGTDLWFEVTSIN